MNNPIDIFLIIFYCCTPFLKQVLISKMFICRLAVPFISIDRIFDSKSIVWIWPLRGIMVETISSNCTVIQESLFKSKLKVVSSIRIGRPSISKSRLLNDIICDQYMDTFFNKECPLGASKRTISNGIIESSWFLPSNDENDLFKDVTMFLNLRGDSLKYPIQCKVLQKLSHIVLLVIKYKELTKKNTIEFCVSLHESGVSVIYAVDCTDDGNDSNDKMLACIKFFVTKMKHSLTNIEFVNMDNLKGNATIKTEIRDKIRSFLQTKSSVTIEQMNKKFVQLGIETDETSSSSCCKGKEKADTLSQEIFKNKKRDMLPLQRLWIEWTEALKKQRRATEALKMKQHDELEMTKSAIRQQQHHLCGEMVTVVTHLIQTLTDLEGKTDESQFFVCFLKQIMDEYSRVNLPALVQIYHNKWAKWESSKGQKNSKKRNALKREVYEAEQNLVEAPFGYEHLVRELGQIFECTHEIGPLSDKMLMENIFKCPTLIAKQLLLGEPFEIMNGDAANVPINWVEEVLKELQYMIGNVKLLSVSVLGIQSSGKSTLLNTMFGLQFAVSAGRCTRGAFVQLVKVPVDKYPFDYIFVIDTEGLRAPEHTDLRHQHDNELATFVIGLGDVTIINVKGENTAEVCDVLQIAVHAFLRLKLTANNKISLYHSCIFVHQNVPAKNAKEKMTLGRKKFVEKLDLMTKEAADQENMSHISSFKEVLDFDSENHVFYLSDFWYGDPPMAPVNVGYSRNVEVMKKFLLTEMAEKRQTFLTLSDTRQRIKDLWEGILTDDFVFSFRNSLEMKAYNSVEVFFQGLEWDLEKFVFEFVYKAAENEFGSCQNKEDLSKAHAIVKKNFRKDLSEMLSMLTKKWEQWLNESPWKEIVIEWKNTKENRLKQIAQDHQNQANNDIDVLKEKYMLEVVQKHGLSQEEETKLFEKAKKVAEKLKGTRPTRQHVSNEFEQMWMFFSDELSQKYTYEDTKVGEQIEDVLMECSKQGAVFLKACKDRLESKDYERMKSLEGSLSESDIQPEYINVQNLDSKSTELLMPDHAPMIMTITNKIFHKIDEMITDFKEKSNKFNILDVKQLFKSIEEEIKEQNDHPEEGAPFNLLNPYKALLLIHVGRYAEIVFSKINEKYESEHGWYRKLNDYKQVLREVFEARVYEQSEEISAVITFNQIVVSSVVSSVATFLKLDVQGLILKDFSHTKYHLITKIMDNLAEKENFDEFCSYINDSKTYAQKWLTLYIENRIFERKSNEQMHMYAYLANKRITNLFEKIDKAVEHACSMGSLENKIELWIKHFIEALNKELPLSASNFNKVKRKNIPDIKRFISRVKNEFCGLQKECFENFISVTRTNVIWLGKSPYKSSFKRLWGCNECCPFCLEPCQKADKDHYTVCKTDYHTCIQHRPVGIRGIKFCDSQKIALRVCNFNVQSDNEFNCRAANFKCSEICKAADNKTFHPYREYKKFIPAWDIAPSKSSRTSDYWSWFVCAYIDKLCQLHKSELPDIPESWKNISKKQAQKSLRRVI